MTAGLELVAPEAAHRAADVALAAEAVRARFAETPRAAIILGT